MAGYECLGHVQAQSRLAVEERVLRLRYLRARADDASRRCVRYAWRRQGAGSALRTRRLLAEARLQKREDCLLAFLFHSPMEDLARQVHSNFNGVEALQLLPRN